MKNGWAFIGPMNKTYLPERAASWQKIGLLRELLSSGKYDAVLWIDADAALTPSSGQILPKLLELHSDKDIIFGSNKPYGNELNMGVNLWRSSEMTMTFLGAIAEMEVPSKLKSRDGEYTLLDHDGANFEYVEGRVGKVDADGRLMGVSPTDGKLWVAHHSVNDLCRAHMEERQWEQGCVQGMLALKAFSDLRERSVVSDELQFLPIDLQTAKCATSADLLRKWDSGKVHSKAVAHWAGCPTRWKIRGLRGMVELHAV